MLETRFQIDRISLSANQAYSDISGTYLLVDEPTLPTKPAFKLFHRTMVLLIYVGAGVLLSIGAGVGAMLLDKTYRYPLDIHHDLGLPVLGEIKRMKKPLPPELLGVDDPHATLIAPVSRQVQLQNSQLLGVKNLYGVK